MKAKWLGIEQQTARCHILRCMPQSLGKLHTIALWRLLHILHKSRELGGCGHTQKDHRVRWGNFPSYSYPRLVCCCPYVLPYNLTPGKRGNPSFQLLWKQQGPRSSCAPRANSTSSDGIQKAWKLQARCTSPVSPGVWNASLHQTEWAMTEKQGIVLGEHTTQRCRERGIPRGFPRWRMGIHSPSSRTGRLVTVQLGGIHARVSNVNPVLQIAEWKKDCSGTSKIDLSTPNVCLAHITENDSIFTP